MMSRGAADGLLRAIPDERFLLSRRGDIVGMKSAVVHSLAGCKVVGGVIGFLLRRHKSISIRGF